MFDAILLSHFNVPKQTGAGPKRHWKKRAGCLSTLLSHTSKNPECIVQNTLRRSAVLPKKGKKPGKPQYRNHPMWPEFEEFVTNGIHFNTLPFGQMFSLKDKNRAEWWPYWQTFLQGVWFGANSGWRVISDKLREEIEQEIGEKLK
jgi:hypothetical protein